MRARARGGAPRGARRAPVAAEGLDEPVVARSARGAWPLGVGAVDADLRDPDLAPGGVVPDHEHDRQAEPVSVSNSKPFSPKAPSPATTTTCASGSAASDTERVGRADAEGAEGPGVEPVSGPGPTAGRADAVMMLSCRRRPRTAPGRRHASSSAPSCSDAAARGWNSISSRCSSRDVLRRPGATSRATLPIRYRLDASRRARRGTAAQSATMATLGARFRPSLMRPAPNLASASRRAASRPNRSCARARRRRRRRRRRPRAATRAPGPEDEPSSRQRAARGAWRKTGRPASTSRAAAPSAPGSEYAAAGDHSRALGAPEKVALRARSVRFPTRGVHTRGRSRRGRRRRRRGRPSAARHRRGRAAVRARAGTPSRRSPDPLRVAADRPPTS